MLSALTSPGSQMPGYSPTNNGVMYGFFLLYRSLNPAELIRKISKFQDKLLKLNSLKKTLERNSAIDKKPYEHIYG